MEPALKIAFVADVHAGNFAKFGGPTRGSLNRRGLDVLATLTNAVELAADCDALMILGDLFHYANPEPALLAQVQEILAQHPNVIVMPGNHDMSSSAYGDHAIAPLAPIAKVVEVPGRFIIGGFNSPAAELWVVPFQPGPVNDWLEDALVKCAGQKRRRAPKGGPIALALHVGISDDATPYYLDGGGASITAKTLGKLCKKYGITFVFSGDWHRHQTWQHSGVELMQVGALAPNRFPPGYEHGDRGPMAIWNGKTSEVIDVPGPRFYKRRWTDGDVPDWPPFEVKGCTRYLKLRVRTADADAAKAWGAEQTGNAGFELDVDRGIERAKARTASFEARQASSLDDAVQLYVKAMPLDKGVSRDRVLKIVRQNIV